MKRVKHFVGLSLLMIVTVSFSQCASKKVLQDKLPVELVEVYSQRWVGGIEEAGSGVNIILLVKDNSVKLDSVYFKDRATKLVSQPQNKDLYVGSFKAAYKHKEDMLMSNEPNGEYGNTLPDEIINKFPFELKENECIVSYQESGTTKYFKITNIIEKEMIAYPSAPPNKH